MSRPLFTRASRLVDARRRALPVVVVLVALAQLAAGGGAGEAHQDEPGGTVEAFAPGSAVSEDAWRAPRSPSTTASSTTTTATPTTTTTAPPTTTTTATPPQPEPLVADPALPEGKGMWIWQPEQAFGGDVEVITGHAVSMGLTHVLVRTGSSRMGNHGLPFLEALLPVAHEAGIRVYGWDFPYLDDPAADADRAHQAITFEAPGGHRIDGFVADIETPSEGTNLSVEGVQGYSGRLRELVGDYPLVVAVPRPSEPMIARYPYDVVIERFDAVMPMVYWLNRQPDSDVRGAVEWLSRYGKPVFPVGQAYDGAPEGGRPGPPPPDEIDRFLDTAASMEVRSVSFWSWQHASADIWETIARSPHLLTSPR